MNDLTNTYWCSLTGNIIKVTYVYTTPAGHMILDVIDIYTGDTFEVIYSDSFKQEYMQSDTHSIKNDALKLKQLYEAFLKESILFNKVHRQEMHTLINRYADITDFNTERGLENINAIYDNIIECEFEGYGQDFNHAFPLQMILDDDYLDALENVKYHEKQKKIEEEKNIERKKERELYEELKAKYEQ